MRSVLPAARRAAVAALTLAAVGTAVALPERCRWLEPLGVGGGGAMSGLSLSPYAPLWFVGTDMGTLFRSADGGRSWSPVHHFETTFSADLPNAAPVGFSADPRVVFHAPAGLDPVRSEDAGVHWSPIDVNGNVRRIRYWVGDSGDPDVVLAATEDGLDRSGDRGRTWAPVPGTAGESRGTFFDHGTAPPTVYHAQPDGIVRSTDGGRSFEPFHASSVRWFAGGRDAAGLTLAYLDTDGSACDWAQEAATRAHCGRLHVSRDGGPFEATDQEGGRQVAMAENDSRTLYVTGHRSWERAYGTKVWVSEDAGRSFELRFHQYDWDVVPYAPWPRERLEWSAVGLDVGWWDSGYYWFAVDRRDARQAGGSGNFFLHVTRDRGRHWEAPFTRYADDGPRAPGKRWRSTGLEMMSVRQLEFHPTHPEIGYAAVMDVGALATEDGGGSWRLAGTGWNASYDHAFDPGDPDRVFAAAGSVHDWPHEWHAAPMDAAGGVLESRDRGRTWRDLAPPGRDDLRVQFLSVAYDAEADVLWAGAQGRGVARRGPDGSWEWWNDGFGAGPWIVPQLEVDPDSGDVYALLSGDYPDWTNRERTGVYRLARGDDRWTHLRGHVEPPPGIDAADLWYYPASFAIDLSPGGDRDTLFLGDLELAGQWLATGVWRSTDGGDTWERVTQFTFPYHLAIDPRDPRRVYASGGYTLDGTWGRGGPLYSTDGGDTWSKNRGLPLQRNVNAVTVDPDDPGWVVYSFFGGGMLRAPEPL